MLSLLWGQAENPAQKCSAPQPIPFPHSRNLTEPELLYFPNFQNSDDSELYSSGPPLHQDTKPGLKKPKTNKIKTNKEHLCFKNPNKQKTK